MTLSSLVNSNLYTGNGSQSVYAYGFKILQASDIIVKVYHVTTGAETSLTYLTDFTLSTIGNVNGGNVTLVSSGQAWLTGGNLTNGWKIFVKRKLALTQSTDIKNQGAFDAERHETRFDQFTMVDQQQQEEINRALKMPPNVTGVNTQIDASEIESDPRVLQLSTSGVTLGPTADEIANAEGFAIAAEAAKDAAELAETHAETAETNAEAAEVAAEGFRDEAEGFKDDAEAAAAAAEAAVPTLTASRAVASDGSGNLIASAVTATELGRLSGVSSAIQTQIDGKMTNPMTTRGDMVYGGASGVGTRVPVSNGLIPVGLNSGGNDIVSTFRVPELVAGVLQNLKITAQCSGNALELIFNQAVTGLGNPCISMRDNTAAVAINEGAQLVTFPATFTIPQGANMGHSNGVAAWIYIYYNYAGTNADAIAVSSTCYDDGILLTTTAIGTGSDNASGMYSNNVISNGYFKRIGRVLSTQATAGTYVTTPTNVALETFYNLDRTSLGNAADLANIDTYKGIAATPENPASGYFKHYFKSDGNLYKLNNAGTEAQIGGPAALASAHILVGSAGGVATDVAMSGDIGIDNTGSTSIAAGAIVNADVNAAAAIAYSKLALSASLVAGDMASSFYEVGTWTPDVRGTGTAGTATYVSRFGRYTRIGRMYFIEGNVNLTSLSGSTGDLAIYGLPATVSNIGLFPSGTISFTTIGLNLVCWGNDNTTQIRFSTIAASSYSAKASSSMSGGGVIGFCIAYSV